LTKQWRKKWLTPVRWHVEEVRLRLLHKMGFSITIKSYNAMEEL
jgi:hypothetical protein